MKPQAKDSDKEEAMNNMQQDPNPKTREQIRLCEYKNCNKAAYYRIDFDCDDMTADVCSKHHDDMLALVGLPDEDE